MAWMYKKGFRINPENLLGYDLDDIETTKNAVVSDTLTKMFEAAPDNRYPAYAALMSDGRLVTDYRSKCEKNIPVGKQFATHQFMVNNAEVLMQESRKRQAIWNGALFGLSATQPEPAVIQKCTADDCSFRETRDKFGFGLERQSEGVPALFGTFEIDPTATEIAQDKRRVEITTRFEGGRNSMRGLEGPPTDSTKPPNRINKV
jgi:hypothetical protein